MQPTTQYVNTSSDYGLNPYGTSYSTNEHQSGGGYGGAIHTSSHFLSGTSDTANTINATNRQLEKCLRQAENSRKKADYTEKLVNQEWSVQIGEIAKGTYKHIREYNASTGSK